MGRPKGYKMSAESRAKTAASLAGRGNHNVPHTEAAKLKISKALVGNTNQTPAQFAVIADGLEALLTKIELLTAAQSDPATPESLLPHIKVALATAGVEKAKLLAKGSTKATKFLSTK
jgi:hypothetical protein